MYVSDISYLILLFLKMEYLYFFPFLILSLSHLFYLFCVMICLLCKRGRGGVVSITNHLLLGGGVDFEIQIVQGPGAPTK